MLADVLEWPEPAEARISVPLRHARLPGDVFESNPIVLRVPVEDRQAAEGGDADGDPRSGPPELRAVARREGAEAAERDEPEGHRVFGQDADADHQAEENPVAPLLAEEGEVAVDQRQAQQQTNGESMVISSEPAHIIGMVPASAISVNARRGLP